MRRSTRSTSLDLVQSLKRDQSTKAVPEERESLIIGKIGPDCFGQVVCQAFDPLVGLLTETAFSARELNNDDFDFRLQLLLPASERRWANASVRNTEKPDCLPVWGWSVLKQRCHVIEMETRNWK
jgi:hypothetical protein